MDWKTFEDLADRLIEYRRAVAATNGTEGWEPEPARDAARFLSDASVAGIDLTAGQRRFVWTHWPLSDRGRGAASDAG